MEQAVHNSKRRSNSQGFALPTVLVASIVMMIVLLAALTGVSSVSSGLRNQYIDQIGRAAAKSGLAMADACIKKNSGSITWTNANPLKPNTDCTGTETTSCPTTSTDAACYVLKSGNYRTSFTVGLITDSGGAPTDINSVGIIRGVRKTGGDVVEQYSNSFKASINDTALFISNDSLAGSVISERSGNDSVTVSSTPAASNSTICGIRASDNVVTCTSATGPYNGVQFTSTAMKDVTVSSTPAASNSTICGIRASDNVVTCTSATGPYNGVQFTSTAMKDFGVDNPYTYCGIDSTQQAVCTTSTSSSPFGTTEMKTASVVMNNTSSVCGIYKSNSQVACAAISASPFGANAMKDVSVNTVSGFAACAIYKSNSQVACTTTDSTAPFSGTQLTDIAVSVGTTGGYAKRICGVKRADNQATCASTITTTPFGTTTLTDISVAVSGTTNGEYVCAIKASDGTASCVSAISTTPFTAGIKMLDVSVATDTDGYVCAIYSSTREVNCIAIAASPFSTTTLDATPPALSYYLIY